jgi:ABC-type nitrate/sulfonate/bicarbonate transport system permease component
MMEKHKFYRDKSLWINIIVVVLFLLAWELLLANQDNLDQISSFVKQATGWRLRLHALSNMAVPRPSKIITIMSEVPKNGRGGWEYFWYHAQSTLSAAVLGFLIGNFVAIIFAVLLVYIKPLERALMPIFLVIRSVPLAAITPLLLRIRYTLADMPVVQENPLLFSLFGTGQAVKMLIVVMIVFFPTMINVHEGLKKITLPEIELMKSLNASGWQVFWKVRIFVAMPLTFAALKIASASSVLAVTVAEWLGSDRGLGFVMSQGSSASLDSRHVWASIIIITGFGLLFYYAVSFLEKILIPWHESVIALKQAMNGLELDALPDQEHGVVKVSNVGKEAI